MASWKRICCPIDFSDQSRFAMEEAAHLAWRFGGDLTLVYVRGRQPPRRASGVLAFPDAIEPELLAVQRQASEWASAAERIASSTVGYSLLTGDPVEEIVRFAREAHVGVIVMATRSRSEGGPRNPDSVASAVVQDAPCSVVVARPAVTRKDLKTA